MRAPRSSKTHRRRLAPIFFLWLAGNADGSTREGMGFRAEPTVLAAPNTEVLSGAPHTRSERIKPDTVLVATDLAATPEPYSDAGFTVIDAPTS